MTKVQKEADTSDMEIIKSLYMVIHTISVISLRHLLCFQLIVDLLVMYNSEKLLLLLSNTTAHYVRSENGGFGLCAFFFLQSYVFVILRDSKFSHHPYPHPARTTYGTLSFFLCNYCSAVELNRCWSAWWA